MKRAARREPHGDAARPGIVRGNDNLISESDIRRSAHTLPVLLVGADFISRFGSIPRYDSSRCPTSTRRHTTSSSCNGLGSRRWPAHGVGRASGPGPDDARRHSCRRCIATWGLADFDDSHIDEVVAANGSRDLPPGDPAVAEAANAIEAKQLTVFDAPGGAAPHGAGGGRGHHEADRRAVGRRSVGRPRRSSTSSSGCCRKSPSPPTIRVRAPDMR